MCIHTVYILYMGRDEGTIQADARIHSLISFHTLLFYFSTDVEPHLNRKSVFVSRRDASHRLGEVSKIRANFKMCIILEICCFRKKKSCFYCARIMFVSAPSLHKATCGAPRFKENILRSSVFCDITIYCLKIKQRFGGTYRIHLQGRRRSQTRNQHETNSKHSL
jgi:hypothetical protein